MLANIIRFYRLFLRLVAMRTMVLGEILGDAAGWDHSQLTLPENSHFLLENKPVVSPQKGTWKIILPVFYEKFQGLPNCFPRFFQGFSQFSLSSPRFGPFDSTGLVPWVKGWDPFSDTERPKCHGAKLNRGEVLHVPRNAWFTLRAFRPGGTRGNPWEFPDGVFGQWMWERESCWSWEFKFKWGSWWFGWMAG